MTRTSLQPVALLLVAAMAASPVVAATLELPAEWPLGADSQLAIELDGADLRLTTRADGLPVLRARAAVAGETASLEVISSGGSLRVRRPGEAAASAPRLRLEVALGPGRTVRVAGADLAVRAEDPLPAGTGGLSIRLALDGSSAELRGVRVPELEAVASSLRLTGTAGELALTLTGGSAQVSDHQGPLRLVAAGADVTIVDHHGQIVPELDGGSLEIAGGAGSFAGTAAGAHLSFDDWHGPVEVRARDTTLEARGAEQRDRWQIGGSELQVILEQIRGTVEVALDGGSLRGSDLAAGVEATLEGARLDLVEVTGSVTLALLADAEAVLAGIAGSVEAEVTDSRLEIDRADRLRLAGSRAEIAVRRLGVLDPLAISDSELALDLRGILRGPTLELRGAGHARVQLLAPCVVQLTAATALGGRIEVAGCELRTAEQQLSRRQERARYGGELPVHLTATIGPDAGLEVEGEP